MKKQSLILSLFVLSVTGLSWNRLSETKSVRFDLYKKSHLANTNGAPNKKTGAPGEGNCTDCHAGSVQDGSTINQLIFLEQGTSTVVSQYVPGTTYDVVLVVNQTAAKKGFQTVALETTNDTQAGSMTAVNGSTATATFQGRTYVNHTTTSATSGVFTFKWTAPASDIGNIKFYLASNVTNNNGSTSGDMIYLSQHQISPAPPVAPVASFTSTSTSICEGTSVTYTSTSSNNPTSTTWSFPGGNPSTSTSPNPTVTYATAGNYDVSLTVSNTAGTDQQTSTSLVQVQATPALTFGLVNDPLNCGGFGSVSIQSSTNSGTISWNGPVNGTTSGTYPLTASNLPQGSYSIADSSSLCFSNVLSFTLTDPNAPAVPTITSSDINDTICQGESVTLTASSSPGYSWSTLETTQSITVNTSGTYTVTAVDGNCESLPASHVVTVISCASLTEHSNEALLIYPNPTHGELIILNDNLNYDSFSILTSQGTIVFEGQLNKDKTNVTLHNLAKGVYWVELSGKTGKSIQKIQLM